MVSSLRHVFLAWINRLPDGSTEVPEGGRDLGALRRAPVAVEWSVVGTIVVGGNMCSSVRVWPMRGTALGTVLPRCRSLSSLFALAPALIDDAPTIGNNIALDAHHKLHRHTHIYNGRLALFVFRVSRDIIYVGSAGVRIPLVLGDQIVLHLQQGGFSFGFGSVVASVTWVPSALLLLLRVSYGFRRQNAAVGGDGSCLC